MANASLKFRSTGVHSSTVQLGNTELWTLFSLLLGGIIENQNSDFVIVPGIELIQLYTVTKSEF